MTTAGYVWAAGDAYEPFMGRWSRVVAREFVPWLERGPGLRWLDVGCGTGILTRTILELASPDEVVGVDPADGFLAHARTRSADPRARFETADARALPFEDGTFDVVVSGLVLNFVPEPEKALSEMLRLTRAGGTVAAYVWDYANGMQLLRTCWDAAAAIDPASKELDEGPRFAICRPGGLRSAFEAAGLQVHEDRPIDVETPFVDFDDYWTPFLGGQGPAAGYVMSLDPDRREALRERILATLPIRPDGSIPLTARAWAARGIRPAG
jgi:SAM-dependent methyltransferase